MAKVVITVDKNNPAMCHPKCRFAVISFVDHDAYALSCARFGKPLGWYPRLKRLEECIKSTEN